MNREIICFTAGAKFECNDCGERVCHTPDEVCPDCKKSAEEQKVREVLNFLNPDDPSGSG